MILRSPNALFGKKLPPASDAKRKVNQIARSPSEAVSRITGSAVGVTKFDSSHYRHDNLPLRATRLMTLRRRYAKQTIPTFLLSLTTSVRMS